MHTYSDLDASIVLEFSYMAIRGRGDKRREVAKEGGRGVLLKRRGIGFMP